MQQDNQLINIENETQQNDRQQLKKEKKILNNSFNLMLKIFDKYTEKNDENSRLRKDFLKVKEQMKLTKKRNFGQKHMQDLLLENTGQWFRETCVGLLLSQDYKNAIEKNRNLTKQKKVLYQNQVKQLYIYEFENNGYFKKFSKDENAKKLLPGQQEQQPVQEEIVQFVSGEDERPLQEEEDEWRVDEEVEWWLL